MNKIGHVVWSAQEVWMHSRTESQEILRMRLLEHLKHQSTDHPFALEKRAEKERKEKRGVMLATGETETLGGREAGADWSVASVM